MLVLLLALLLLWPQASFAAGTVGFSQVKTGGDHAADEFVELLNPGEAAVDVGGYKIVKETTSGKQYTLTTLGAIQIASHSYLLLALDSGAFSGVADVKYSTALADDNQLLLLDATGQTIDSLGWGAGQSLVNHGPTQSYQRDWQDGTGQWGPWVAQTFSQAHRNGDVWAPATAAPSDVPEAPTAPDPAATPPPPEPTPTTPVPDVPAPPTVTVPPCTLPPDAPSTTNTPSSPAAPSTNPAPSAPAMASAGEIRINEIFANPVGDENAGEFIELYNQEAYPIDLSLWKIADKTISTALVGQSIASQSYVVLTHAISKLTINNSDELISLIDAQGVLRNQVAVKTSHEGQSLNWAESGPWYEAAPSPGAFNAPAATASTPSALTPNSSANDAIAPAPATPNSTPTLDSMPSTTNEMTNAWPPATPNEPVAISSECPSMCSAIDANAPTSVVSTSPKSSKSYQAVTFAQWPRLANQKAVMLGGAVAVLPGTFGERTVFIEPVDEQAAGIELFFSKAAWPNLDIGDVIAVRGHKSKSKLGDRLLIASADDIQVIDHVDLAPADVDIAGLGHVLGNQLVRIVPQRLIVDKKQLVAFVGTAELAVNLQKAHLDLPDVGAGAFPIIGLLKAGAKPELWPRSDDDLLTDQAASPANEAALPMAGSAADPATKPNKPAATVAAAADIAATTSSASASPWLIGSLTFATSGGGLTWYFFQEELKKRAAAIIANIRKANV